MRKPIEPKFEKEVTVGTLEIGDRDKISVTDFKQFFYKYLDGIPEDYCIRLHVDESDDYERCYAYKASLQIIGMEKSADYDNKMEQYKKDMEKYKKEYKIKKAMDKEKREKQKLLKLKEKREKIEKELKNLEESKK